MSPIPGHGVFHPKWAEHHRPTAESTMTEPAVFRRLHDGPAPYPMPEGWDPSEVIWRTKVRVQALSKTARDPIPAEQPVTVHDYLVTAPVGGPNLRTGEHGDVVEVLGRTLRIVDAVTGSQVWELDLTCTDNQTQSEGAAHG